MAAAGLGLFTTTALLFGSLDRSFAQEVVDTTAVAIGPELMLGIRDAFAERLTDPTSLQLRRLRMAKLSGSDYDVVCGEFNGKNGFGGYVGFQHFVYLPPYKSIAFNGQCLPE
ncbi:hypothetical protein BPNPMPFG_000858 [Mesorhizobium sp. AR07]|uniref:hypothetical protein n=1 Tax=Mesorhizobium sp. AR07 TaxID=2865838 RepID=UPI00215E19A3|nr:hypothetical protein [Mesorhizobium sp. AR07]UVK45331.1 hypothetical protein BPNPMPFG_000858 [Mesorhizobium sp. AR07]